MCLISFISGGSLTCLNGGTCNPSTGVCSCLSGYTGSTCATALGCVAGGLSSCLNGGYCNPLTGICSCLSAFTGATCSIFVNTFVSSVGGCNAGGQFSCLNGGVCIPSTGLCNCLTGFSGIICAFANQNTYTCGSDGSPILCATFAASNYCSFNFLYNLQPVPVFCPFSCKLCNQGSG